MNWICFGSSGGGGECREVQAVGLEGSVGEGLDGASEGVDQ